EKTTFFILFWHILPRRNFTRRLLPQTASRSNHFHKTMSFLPRLSFLRKRESSPFREAETFAAGENGAALPLLWIPAFAGMTWGKIRRLAICVNSVANAKRRRDAADMHPNAGA
ncbi:MAG: hypothetical protein ACR2P5_05605, partial [Gammaproteobacteria bacterium]